MNEKGFTLVEVLVALVAGGLLLGSISWVLGGLSDDLRRTENQIEALQVNQTAELLENVLSDARFADAEGGAKPRSAQNLSFRMTAPMAFERRGYVEANLSIQSDENGKNLKLNWPDEGLEEVSLLSGMDDVQFQYEVNGENAAFLNRITIVYLERGGDQSRKLNIRPKINAVGACVFDPISQRCRT